MIGYLIRRTLWGLLLLVVVSFFTFILFFVIPSSQTPSGQVGTNVITLRESYELENAALPLQYGEFLWDIVRHGSMGRSFIGADPVSDVVARALPVTASLVLGGALLWLGIAFAVGVVSALRPRSLIDRVAMILTLIGLSAHPAWIGLVLSYLLGYRWSLTPISGYCDLIDPSTQCGGAVQWAYHLLLPWLTFAMLFAALYARMVRASVIESLDEDYVRTARAKGASRWRMLRVHVLRNALLPVITMVGMDVGVAFGGSVFVERVFGLPGMGLTLLTAITRRDQPVIMGVVLTVTAAIVVLNIVVDLLYAALDPRVRITERSHDFGKEQAEPKRTPRRAVAAGPAS